MDLLGSLLQAPQQLFAQFPHADQVMPAADFAQWAEVSQKLQALWLEFQSEQAATAMHKLPAMLSDPGGFAGIMQGWLQALPLADPATQKKLWEDSLALWETVLGQYGIGPQTQQAESEEPQLPRKDRRFADPKWREQPFHALVHQTYLLLAEQILALAEAADPGDPAKHEQLKFAARTLIEALSPAHFPMLNPLVMEKALETKGESLVKGFEHLLTDLKRGQLTHVDPQAFRLGENLAITPGKVVHETPLYQLIQYSPATDSVLEVPLVIFPPWINRFYILDLTPQKSFIRWAVEQGLTVFVVSWKSADETMADLGINL